MKRKDERFAWKIINCDDFRSLANRNRNENKTQNNNQTVCFTWSNTTQDKSQSCEFSDLYVCFVYMCASACVRVRASLYRQNRG